ncbi:MAG: IS1634 family transposase [Bacteroidales bacterium]|nr:IS1634 family transposase [Candidatus Physcousia equi]
MHFMSQPRYNPRTQRDEWYYRIKESFRDLIGCAPSRIMLNVGFIEEPHRPEDIRDIGKCLTYMHEHQGQVDLFGNPLSRYNEFVQRKAQKFWHEMINNGSIDAVKATMEELHEKAERLVDVNAIIHTDAREVGAEWVCLQAIRELERDKLLRNEGWSEIQINTTLAHLITLTIYSPSELKSMRIMDENSAVCELISGNQEWRPGFQSIYKAAPSLYELKDELESHLCQKTDDLFNITNRIAIFDLTNFYFEGRKDNSKKAQFGRSKEKRSDCKLLVLALCINKEGFIRYSSILAGNTADPNSLPDMVDTLNAKTRMPNDPKDKVLVCLHAGIATEDNLQKIKEKGYNYLCVSRRRLTDYELATDAKTLTVLDSKKQPVKLTQVEHEEDGDYYLEINFPAKDLKETSMNRKFKERFEEDLQNAKDSLTKKNVTKNYEKVIERVGGARQKYPSISKYYVIDYIADNMKNPKNMDDIEWCIAVPENVDKQSGIYFLRTNVSTFDEKTTWDYCNLTRKIECTNHQLKTDLNLRPIHHKKDDRLDAHLFFGILSYWIVNTIRYKLKQTGDTCFWTEIVRRLSTQKAVTTEATNALGEKVHMRLCSEPNKSADDIYERLRYKKTPFGKNKIEKSL